MSRGKILVVEDDRDIVEMVEYNLKQEGYETIHAYNGEKGIDLAGDEKPDLIILDLMLPAIDGFEVCKTLKQQQSTSRIPIIILSAKSRETDKVVGLELGADDYITKPFSPRELIARIRAVLRRHKEQPAERDKNRPDCYRQCRTQGAGKGEGSRAYRNRISTAGMFGPASGGSVFEESTARCRRHRRIDGL